MKAVQTYEDGEMSAVVDVPDFMAPPEHPRQSVVADDHPVSHADVKRKWDHEKKETAVFVGGLPEQLLAPETDAQLEAKGKG